MSCQALPKMLLREQSTLAKNVYNNYNPIRTEIDAFYKNSVVKRGNMKIQNEGKKSNKFFSMKFFEKLTKIDQNSR